MTPKEKAQEIFNKMYLVDDVMGNYPMCFDTAKKCALIAVDVILNDCGAKIGQVMTPVMGKLLARSKSACRCSVYT